jgi:alpha-L-fucosidase
MKKSILLTGIILIFLMACNNQKVVKKAESGDRMKWWDNARFGMMITWGVHSVPAGIYNGREISYVGEWIMNRAKIPVAEYRKYAAEFNPVKYDPEAWVRLAKKAGMKYIVIITKHHDGFALFDSKVSSWDVVDATPYGKDLLKPLVEACRREGIKIGFYYSHAQDWTHPGGAASRKLSRVGWPNPDSTKIDQYSATHRGHWDPAQEGSMDEYLDNIAVPQVKEILSNYGDIDILWWDTPEEMTPERAKKFLPILEKYPKLITNDRLGGGSGGDTQTAEQFIPPVGFPGRHWEANMTLNDTWGYKSTDNNWKSTRDLILKLSDIVSKGGNFLLNVGPDSKGEIPQPSVDRLKQVGDWMELNHEAIYGTKASPFSYLPWGRATLKEQRLYLHVLTWPKEGLLKVPLQNKPVSAWLLSAPDSKLPLEQDNDRILIKLPANPPDSIISIVVLEFEGAPKVLPVPSTGKTGMASSVDSTTSIVNLFDGKTKNAWKPDPKDANPWVVVDLGEPIQIGCFSITEPWHPWDSQSQKFTLQYKKGEKWVDVITGNTNGCGHTQDFEPVTARYFRLTIRRMNGQTPIINEWVLSRAL